MVVPVLTAHPTEVRRKSTIDREMEIAELMAERDRPSLTGAELKANETALRRAILTLWQTSPLRRTRLRVIDEVANGLSYYDYTFLSELPRFYADLEEELAASNIALADGLPSFLRVGSWIGSDRDGNPFVTEGVLRATLRAQSSRALKFYLDEVHKLGGELSLDSTLVPVSDALAALAARSPDRSANRRDEPYRRAITGIYARLAATARVLNDLEAPHTPSVMRRPMRTAGSCSPIWRYSTALSLPMAPEYWRRDVSNTYGAPSMSLGFISQRSICARTPMCMSAPSAKCSVSCNRALTTLPLPSRSGSACCWSS
jgi:phosphoenolpyruvate carboxylase